MGAYLSTPVFEPESLSGSGRGLSFGASSVQGWRTTQEDAHNCIIDFDVGNKCSLFAVYDGHGGGEVAQYCSLHLPDFIKTLNAYKNGDLKQALIDAFIKFDETLTKPESIEILKQLSMYDSADEGDEDEVREETDKLREEACMPLSQILKGYMKSPEPNDDESTEEDEANITAEGSEAVKNGRSGDKLSKDETKENLKNEDNAKNTNGDVEESGSCSGAGGAGTSKVDSSEAAGSSAGGSGGSLSGVSGAASSSSAGRGKRAAAQKAKNIIKNGDDDADNDDDDDDDDDDDEEENDSENASESEDEGLNGDGNDSEDDEDDDDEDEENESDILESDIPGSGSGSTAVVALLKDDILYVANAGDSRAVVCRNGKAIDMSVDHKPEDAIERTRIEHAGGKITSDGRVNGGLNLSRAIGDHVYKQNSKLPLAEQMISPLPDIQSLTIDRRTDDFMVLACDGIWNCMTSQEVCDFVSACLKNGDKLSDICEQLFRRCIAPDTSGDGTGCDNMTCIVVRFKEEEEDEAQSAKRPLEGADGNISKKVRAEESNGLE